MSTTLGLWPKRFGWLNVPGVALMVLAVNWRASFDNAVELISGLAAILVPDRLSRLITVMAG